MPSSEAVRGATADPSESSAVRTRSSPEPEAMATMNPPPGSHAASSNPEARTEPDGIEMRSPSAAATGPSWQGKMGPASTLRLPTFLAPAPRNTKRSFLVLTRGAEPSHPANTPRVRRAYLLALPRRRSVRRILVRRPSLAAVTTARPSGDAATCCEESPCRRMRDPSGCPTKRPSFPTPNAQSEVGDHTQDFTRSGNNLRSRSPLREYETASSVPT
jgi:hypothetical protein